MKALLDRAVEDGKLADLMQRAREAYPFQDHPAPEFWFGLAEWARRSASEWTPALSPKRDASDFLYPLSRRIRRVPDDRDVLAAVLRELVESHDPHIAPRWLQAHSLHFGMFRQNRRDDLAEVRVLSEEQTMALMRHQATWAAEAFKGGELFFELHHGLILHQLADISAWDEKCRERLRELIETPRGIDQFALVFFGGNHTTQRTHLQPLLDLDRAMARAKERLQELQSSSADEPYVLAALTKLLDGFP